MTLRYREDPLLCFPFLDLVGCMRQIEFWTRTCMRTNSRSRPDWIQWQSYCAWCCRTRSGKNLPPNIVSFLCPSTSLHQHIFVHDEKHAATEKRGTMTRSQKKACGQPLRQEINEILKRTKVLVMVQLLGQRKKNSSHSLRAHAKAMYLIWIVSE